MASHAQNRPLSGERGKLLQLEPRRPRRPKARLAAVLLVLGLLALIAPSFIHLNRFRQQLTTTLSTTLGRDVTVEKVWLHLLPRPGFTIKNFTIADDSAFGAEPMISSEDVSASLRLSSLWRGRLEIASLTLKAPSLNLVRDSTGRWNIEALLERAAHTPSAPTAKTRPETRPRFPYIEAEDGRINVKFEQEKKVYALSETDFALWLASEDEWNMRLAGHPIRTDADLRNTGTLKAEGGFKRAADLRSTPVRLEVRLEGAQLGQLTHLIYGFDRGWRGAASFSATLNGTPADFSLSTSMRVADFRRYDIARADNLTLQTHCDAHYRAIASTTAAHVRNFFLNLQCNSPVQDGQLVLHAELFPGQPQPLVDVIAVSLPLSSVAAVVRHAKKGTAEDFTATGTVSGNLAWRDGELGGSWIASGVRLRSDALRPAVVLDNLIFSIQRDERQHTDRSTGPAVMVRVLPFSMHLGGPTPMDVQATFSPRDYSLSFNGMADSERLAALFDTLGLPLPPGITAETGMAKVDLEVSGLWAGFAAPRVVGNVRTQSASMVRAGIKQQ